LPGLLLGLLKLEFSVEKAFVQPAPIHSGCANLHVNVVAARR
jgi:hypothetical protein